MKISNMALAMADRLEEVANLIPEEAVEKVAACTEQELDSGQVLNFLKFFTTTDREANN